MAEEPIIAVNGLWKRSGRMFVQSFLMLYNRNRWGICVLLVVPTGIMLYNACALPTFLMYDADSHIGSIKYFGANDIFSCFSQALQGNAINIHAPLYYFITGLLLKLFSFSDFGLVLLLRIINIICFIVFFIVILHLFFSFTEKNVVNDLALIVSIYCVPNLYVFVSQVRPEILLLPLLASFLLLFYTRLHLFTIMCIAVVMCLVTITKYNAASMFPVMLAAVAAKLFRNNYSIKYVVIFILLTTLCSMSFYIIKFTYNDMQLPKNTYYENKYKQKEQNLDRIALFTNLEFGKLFETPNRKAQFANGNNSIFPRLYGDMWGDHWLYYSGSRQGEESKTLFKRVAFIAGSFFTIFYFGATIWGAFGYARSLLGGRLPEFADMAAALSATVLAFLVFTAVCVYPTPGKNHMVKFVYLMPTALLSMPKMRELSGKLMPGKYYAMYVAAVFALCLPLHIYTE